MLATLPDSRLPARGAASKTTAIEESACDVSPSMTSTTTSSGLLSLSAADGQHFSAQQVDVMIVKRRGEVSDDQSLPPLLQPFISWRQQEHTACVQPSADLQRCRCWHHVLIGAD